MPSLSLPKALALLASLAINFSYAAPTLRADAPANNDAIVADLITAPTVIKRFRELLTDAGQTALSGDALAKASIYDFNANSVPIPGSNGGKVGAALVDTMPYLLDSGLNTNLGYVGPCGVLVPHVHPRASEFFTVVAGELLVGTIPERGLLNDGSSPLLTNNLTQYQGTLFPQGAIHYQQNLACNQVVAIATLSNADPGTTPYTFPVKPGSEGNTTTVKRQGDASEAEEWAAIKETLPWYIVEPADECRQKCGIA
ncbi:hypothetical protein K491DRAFT_664847 [Lophiostoma macrostomum CBS 122681]|uniref:Cupin type-1 domain-containing protein n=1 Tax=Lophiostoma macrostomum CBS 122681 TaxID=1314788 RepID=A0A6A6SXS8_9PLEO|nr:hypothetical protein K491DRAFT_664847 [Lophiostoma macrostomum CBS 122681]